MNVTDGMRKAVETLIEEWKTDSDVVLWEDERPLEGFLQKHVLLHDPEREEIKVFRVWTGEDAVAHISVDVDKPVTSLSGEVDDMDWPHRDLGGEHETALRAGLAGEHVEILWCNEDGSKAAVIGRSAKVGRDEQIIAARVSLGGAAPDTVDIWRMPAAALLAAKAMTPSR